MSVTVYPAVGHFLTSVPVAPLSVSAAVAKRLIRTGAFTDKRPKGEQPEPVELTDEGLASLDYYDPPGGEPEPNEAPQDAGPSDSPAKE